MNRRSEAPECAPGTSGARPSEVLSETCPLPSLPMGRARPAPAPGTLIDDRVQADLERVRRRRADLDEVRQVLASRRAAGLTLRHRRKLARIAKETP